MKCFLCKRIVSLFSYQVVFLQIPDMGVLLCHLQLPCTAVECYVNIPFLPVDSSFPRCLEMYSRNGSAVPQRCCILDESPQNANQHLPKFILLNDVNFPFFPQQTLPISSSCVSSSSTLGIHIHCFIYCDLIVFCSGDAIAPLANVNTFFVSRCIILHLTLMEHMLTKWAA